MITCTVFARRKRTGTGHDMDRAVFVREGLSVLAVIAPVLWLIWNRMFVSLFVVGAGLAAVGALAAQFLSPWAVAPVSLLVNVWFGLEAANYRKALLRYQGYEEVGIVDGGSIRDCEERFFYHWEQGHRARAAAADGPSQHSADQPGRFASSVDQPSAAGAAASVPSVGGAA